MLNLKTSSIAVITLLLVSLFSADSLSFESKQKEIEKLTQNISTNLQLPASVTNNGVAIATVSDQTLLFSFNGLASGKTHKDIHNQAYSVNLATGKQKRLSSVPGDKGKLASIAVTIKNRIFLIGGYTVAADHSEISTPEIVEYLPSDDSYQAITNMPVPVDDTVALVYQQRYLYLVSGWHDTDNVALVQVYDVEQERWFYATPFPGAPVFGHAGGIVDNQLLIVDGVKVNTLVNGKKRYVPSNENWMGQINPTDPKIIEWKKVQKHPFAPLYRMASTGIKNRNEVVFAGGSDNPYNYNGVGYDGAPSEPSPAVFGFNFINLSWSVYKPLVQPSMDHRGLLTHLDEMFILGGMGAKQKVLSRVNRFQLNKVSGQ